VGGASYIVFLSSVFGLKVSGASINDHNEENSLKVSTCSSHCHTHDGYIQAWLITILSIHSTGSLWCQQRQQNVLKKLIVFPIDTVTGPRFLCLVHFCALTYYMMWHSGIKPNGGGTTSLQCTIFIFNVS